MKTYRAKRRGLINYLFIGLFILPATIFFFNKNVFIERPFALLLLLTPVILIAWTYFGTFYKIAETTLFYRSGFLRGNIDIFTIKEIIRGKTMWTGIKPALAPKGLIVKFNRHDEVYIAPVDNDEIISDLLRINSDIKIVDHV